MSTQRFSRRIFLGSAAALTASAITRRSFAIAAPQRPPNILLIMSDEHNARVAGCYGSQIARTPNLDALAARGITFENCYCNSPLCVPSRSSFTAGKYISRVGVWNNSCELPSADYPSLPRILNAAGYQSFLCGKQHYARDRRYGFAEIGGNFNNSTKSGRGGRREPDKLTANRLSARFDDFRTGEQSGVLKHDQRVTAGAMEFLDKRSAEDKPFFLFVGYLAPHFPLIVPEAYYRRYEGRVGMPEMPPGHLENLPLNYKHLRSGFQVVDVPESLVRKGRELYFGLTEWIDNEIGQVIGALRKSRVAENTVVIYTSDHGENMGEHGMWWKNCMYEHAARIPLIISDSRRWKAGQRRVGACSLVDVVRTCGEIGQARVPEDWNGTSLCRWMDDPSEKWKDLAVSEYYAHNIASGFAMVRRGRYKYVYHTPPDEKHPAQRELYDLETDPGEFTNLAVLPDQQQQAAAMHALLAREIGEDPNETELKCRADFRKAAQRGGTPAKEEKEE